MLDSNQLNVLELHTEVVVFWLLRRVVRWLETNVSEAVLPPSSGLRFVNTKIYPRWFPTT